MTEKQWSDLRSGALGEYTAGEILSVSADAAVYRVAAPAEHAEAGSCLIIREAADSSTCEAERSRLLEAMFLQHPNLLRIFDSGCSEYLGQPLSFAVTEPLEYSLADAPAHPRAESWIAGVASALEHLHESQLVYCALSARSVWHAGGEWKLGDFSLLRAEGNYDPHEMRRLMIRPELSVPPEAWEGIVSPSWDAWSLGNLMHVAGSDDSRATGLLEPDPSQRLSVRQFSRQRSSAPVPTPPDPIAIEPLTIAPPLVPSHADQVHANAARVIRSSGRVVVWASVALAFAVLLVVAVTVWGHAPDHTPAQTQAAPVAASSKPAPAPVAHTRQTARQQITDLLNRWVESTRTRNVDEQVSCYAPVVKRFFGRRNLSAAELRNVKRSAFDTVGEVGSFDIADVVLNRLDGDSAVVSFRKEWNFPKRHFSGTESDQMELRRIDNDWKIVSERENGGRRTQMGE